MAGEGPLRVAIVGCGNISKGYCTTMLRPPQKVVLAGAHDPMRERAEALTREFGGKVYDSMDAMLGDGEVEAVINLTVQKAHFEVTSRILEAGKHVHSEKPLAMTAAEAQKLVKLAHRKKCRLSTAPATFLGECQQTAWKALRERRLGPIRVAYAEMNHGRIESWHPNPEPFYAVGDLYDVGVYPLTVLTTFFGPVASVRGFEKVLWPDRKTQAGQAFQVTTEDWTCSFLEFESGLLGRLTTSFYVGPTKQNGMEFHGDTASLWVSSAVEANGQVQIRPFGTWEWNDIPLVRPAEVQWHWGQGVLELADAIREDRPQRATGEQAAHVVEIINGIKKSSQTGRPVNIKSRFQPPTPMPWAV